MIVCLQNKRKYTSIYIDIYNENRNHTYNYFKYIVCLHEEKSLWLDKNVT